MGRIILDFGFTTILGLWLGAFWLAAAAGAEPTPELTHCADVRALTRQEADQRRPVKICGVLTSVSSKPPRSCFIHDGTGGIFAFNTSQIPGVPPATFLGPGEFKRGTRVEIEGQTMPGGFSPCVAFHQMRWLGEAPVPNPTPVTLTQLRTGTFDAEPIEIQGVVQRLQPESGSQNRWQLDLATEEGVFIAVVDSAERMEAAQWVDATVRIRGICYAFFNARAELVRIGVRVAQLSDVEILTAANPDPYAAPEVDPLALRPFRQQAPSLHRQRLTGTVTLCRPGDYFYVRMAQRSVRVNTRSPERLQPGDQVEVSGFVRPTEHFTVMSDAIFRKIGRAQPPEPSAFTRKQILAMWWGRPWQLRVEDYDGALVKLGGSLVKVESVPEEEPRIHFDNDGRLLVGYLPANTPPEKLAALQPGSTIEVTGICVVLLGTKWGDKLSKQGPMDFNLLLRNADDICVRQTPAWWTPGRLWLALGLTLGLLLLALAWVQLLRRMVAERSHRLAAEQLKQHQAKIEFDAILQERERMAADLHDTLAQSLTGLAFQLDTLKQVAVDHPTQVSQHLELATQMLARGRQDVRRSVWNLCTQWSDGASLRDAIRRSLGEIVVGGTVVVECGGVGEELAVPSDVARHLLLIAGEAVANAIKHGAPHRIVVTVDYRPTTVVLTVTDDGQGFDPERTPGPHQGHFGLQGMRERARRLHADLRVVSSLGKGSSVSVSVNLH